MGLLRVMDSIPFTFIWLTALVIKGAKDGQKVLRNLTVKPSIPGAEFGCMSLNRDSSSSSSERKPSSSCFSSSGICCLSSS